MKKAAILISLVSGLLMAAPFSGYAESIYKPPQKSRKELYQDIFVSLLMPHIGKAVGEYYTKFLKVSPTVYPYDVHVVSAERLGDHRSFVFLVKVQTDAVVGPHIDVGIDRITFEISGDGKAEMKKFEHIKTFELPPHYQAPIF